MEYTLSIDLEYDQDFGLQSKEKVAKVAGEWKLVLAGLV
jgi:hypothetical protein